MKTMETLKFRDLKPHQVWSIKRDDGVVVATTDDPKRFVEIISEEFCQVKVEINEINYNKHDYSYNILAQVYEDGDKEGVEYEFIIEVVTHYKKSKLVHDIMVAVFFESNSHAELAGFFPDEETYMNCLPALELYAKENRMVVTESLGQETIIKELKTLLEQQGYYTASMFQLEDVKASYDCTDVQAREVLKNAMNNEATTNQIWESIECACDVMGIKKREPVDH